MAGNRLSNTDSFDADLVQEVVGGPVLSWLQTYYALSSGSDAYCDHEFYHPKVDERLTYWYTPFYELPTYSWYSQVLHPDATVPSGDFPGRSESDLGIQMLEDVRTYVAGVPASGDPLSSSFVNDALDRLESLDRFLLTRMPSLSSVLTRSATNTDRGTTGTAIVSRQVGETVCSGATQGDDYSCENVSRTCSTPVVAPVSMSPSGQHDDTDQETSDALFYVNYEFYAGKDSTYDWCQTYESRSGYACYDPDYNMTYSFTEQVDFASAQYGNVDSVDFEPPDTIDIPLVDTWPSCAPAPALVSAWLVVRSVYASVKRTWNAKLNHYNRPDPDSSYYQYTSSVPSDERPFADVDTQLANNVAVLVEVQGTLVVSGGALKLRVSGGTSLRDRVLAAAGVTLPSWAVDCIGATGDSTSPAIVSERPGAPAMELPALAKAQQGFSLTSTSISTWDTQTDTCSGPADWYTGHVNVSARVQLSAGLMGAVVVLKKGDSP